jgi:8-oxo-dGTP pyrophosphatase MutT (NUDIX family)
MPDNERAVRPRDAATLVIYRHGPQGLEVVMGRRSDKARFKPGVYVFPGGRVEASDGRVISVTPLSPQITPKVAVGGSEVRARALALAAIRETFEESGLIVGAPGDLGTTSNPSWSAMRARGFAPVLDTLHYLGRAITPSVQPIRFHARFFAVDARHAHGEFGGDSELSDLQWVPASEAEKFEIMGVTLLMIESVQRLVADPDSYKAPFLRFQYGRRQLDYV